MILIFHWVNFRGKMSKLVHVKKSSEETLIMTTSVQEKNGLQQYTLYYF